MEFSDWLTQKKGFAPATIEIHLRYSRLFLDWLKKQDITVVDARYNNILDFIGFLRKAGRNSRNINRVLGSVKYYYNYLNFSQEIKNPVTGLFVRGTRQRATIGLLSPEMLEKLYLDYPSKTNRQQRNKLITGLLVYQALTTAELNKLNPKHIDFEKGTIYIPSGRRSNSRTLKLEPCQLMPLLRYINETRPQMLKDIAGASATLSIRPSATLNNLPARKPQKIDLGQLKQQLLFSINGSCSLKNTLVHLFRDLKQQNLNVEDAEHIRKSVITNWLKTYDLRIVQYMAGHRYVSSTERYKEDNLKDLQEALKKHHPLRNEK